MNKILAVAAFFVASLTTTANAEIQDCTEITALPAVITVQGIYCFKQHLSTGITSGKAIDIQTNNVIIDLNGWKLGGLAAGASTQTTGIDAAGRKNITIRNGAIRGFYKGIELTGAGSAGHRVEDLALDNNRHRGIEVHGDGVRISNNSIVNTGPGDVASQAVGILVNNSSGGVINGNLIFGLEETGQIYGIRVENSSEFEISANKIFGIKQGLAETGIVLVGGDQTAVFDNTIVNEFGPAINDNGVNSDNTLCIDNRVRGDAADPVSCDVEANNQVF